MKTYVSDKYWGKETIDINYDTINNYKIESKNYLCLEDNVYNPMLYTKEIISYFIANDQNGIGLCTVDSEGNSSTTYYEDEEWCEVFSGLSTEDEYYDDFSKLEDIRNIINYNVSIINQKNKNYKILSEIPEVKIRDANGIVVGIAEECYVIKQNTNSFNLVLNKIISNRLSKIVPKSLTIEIDGLNYDIWRNFYDNNYSILENDGIMIFNTREYNSQSSTTIADVTNDNDINIEYDYDDSGLNIEYVDIVNILNDKKLTYENREEELRKFNNHYNYVFKKEIDIVKFLLS